MDSGPTKTFLSGLKNCPLHRKTPFGIANVSSTQLSIARHYGGIKYNGAHYTYIPTTDELIRDDVLKWKRKQKKAAFPKVIRVQAEMPLFANPANDQ